MGRPVKKIMINDYQRGLKFEITDRATMITSPILMRSGLRP
jgi:hypothetical protein